VLLSRSVATSLVVVAGALAMAAVGHATTRPSIVFLLLDTTRADHFGSWGYAGGTTPTLDALAHRGVRFARHYANSHATRPSMPQLMSGRYFHDNILAPFQTDAHPREMSFARPDPTSILLPRLLRTAGYASAGVSAHTWVSPNSAFGREFDRFELLSFTPKEAHGDATAVVDRALALWQARDRSRPLFLYLHFMDAHIPRRIPEDTSLPPIRGYDWRTRFRDNGEPAFGRNRRRWSRHDASDFTPDDRLHYAAVYDARLRHADREIGRLLAALEVDDPGLRSTVVVVTADHGEELAEDGRIEHPASLAEAVQHVPWIVSGGAVVPEQRCDGFTEHVDVVPTIAGLLDLALDGVTVDGTPRLKGGRLRRPCGSRAAFYAWEEYRAVRTAGYLLVEYPSGGVAAHCMGSEHLYRVTARRREAVNAPTARRRRAWLSARLHARLAEREHTYRSTRYAEPRVPFFARAGFWTIEPKTRLRCLDVDEDTPRRALLSPGWFTTGQGIALARSDGEPARIRLDAPAGRYVVEAATRPISRAPWLFGVRRWRWRTFGVDRPSDFVRIGTWDAVPGGQPIELPVELLSGHHVLGVRLTPPGVTPPPSSPAVDREHEERLRALGYVQ
jgi:arylsulfatase A-like enzyme